MQSFLRAAFLAAVFCCAALRGECATTFSSDASDLWWNPDESGWGINIEQQGNVIFATLFVYAADGKAHWYVAPDTEAGSAASSPIVFNGALYETTGPAFSTAFNPNAVGTRQVGTLSFAYTAPGNAQLMYSVDGVTVNKNVVRQTWRNATLQSSYHIWRTVGGGGNGCTIGSFTDNMLVSQSGSSVNIQLLEGNSTRCVMNGTIEQNGRVATIRGTASCNGSTGPFVFGDLEIGVHGFTGYYQGQDLNGCVLSGHVAGVVDSPP